MTEETTLTVPAPEGEPPCALRWSAVPGAEAYVVCRLRVPVRAADAKVLQAGGLDLLMERYVLPASCLVVGEDERVAWPHRLVVARLPGGRLRPAGEICWDACSEVDAPPLARFGPAAESWTAGVRVGRPPAPRPEPGPRLRTENLPVTSTLEERGTTARKPAALVEGGLTIREGPLVRPRAPTMSRTPSPLEAYERQLRPRRVAGATLPDLRTMRPATTPAPPTDTAPEHPAPLRWAVVGSTSLLLDAPVARAALRLLRGFVRVALVSRLDRQTLERRAAQIGVPLDGLFALPPDAPTLPQALGCGANEIVVFTLPDEDALPGARHVEVPPERLAEAAESLCDEL